MLIKKMKMLPPLKNAKISQPYGKSPLGLTGYYKKYGLAGHNGIDIYTFWGDNVYAAHDGTVLKLKENPFGFGRYVRLISEKKDGFYWVTYYGHLSEIKVITGQKVKAGDIIGLEGNTGACVTNKDGKYVPAQDTGDYTGTHVHFGVYKFSDPIPNTYQLNFSGKSYTAINYYNGYHGAIDPYPLIYGDAPDTKDMLKIIGDKSNNKQYVLGVDGKLRWIFNQYILQDLHDAGVINKLEVEWVDDVNKYDIINPWASIA